MNEEDSVRVIKILFDRFRRHFKLGIGELQAALDVVLAKQGPKNHSDLNQALRLLWCHSLDDRCDLDNGWQQLMTELQAEDDRQEKKPLKKATSFQDIPTEPNPVLPGEDSLSTTIPPLPLPRSSAKLAAIPCQTPPLPVLEEEEIRSQFPVSCRDLAYGWRTLRQLRADGPWATVDVAATVERTARQGFYAGPVLQRGLKNHAKLLLLIDKGGSMMPFHRFSRDVVQTALEDSDLREAIRIAYFSNVPHDYIYEDAHLTKPIAVQSLLEWCDRSTSVIVVSDGGAARGNLQIERIRSTTQFLVKVQAHTPMIGWLNPVPKMRWENTSAELISYIVSMEVIDSSGFKQLLDRLRG
jgi:uncharacterized protein